MTARPDLAEIERLARVVSAMPSETVLVLIQRVKELEAALEWRTMETAPKDGEHVLLFDGESGVGEAAFHPDEDGWWWAGTDPTDFHDGRVWSPAKWQPLPPPPKEQTDG